MNIGIVGSGIVAQTLGAGFLKHGHTVMLGSREPKKLAPWQSQHSGAKLGSFADAAKFGEVVVLAVKGEVALGVLRVVADGLAGKTVIDTSNPIADAPPVNGVLKFFTSLDESLLEQLQKACPKARFVKAFSSVGSTKMVNPQFAGGPPTMFICGNDAAAKQAVTRILDEFGWDTLDLGGATAARAIEPLCILWCIPGFLNNEWTHAFKVLHT
jgi:predicted dinucleotide-binding enzyme